MLLSAMYVALYHGTGAVSGIQSVSISLHDSFATASLKGNAPATLLCAIGACPSRHRSNLILNFKSEAIAFVKSRCSDSLLSSETLFNISERTYNVSSE